MIYVSVVSHGHFEIISKLNSLPALASDEQIKVCVKDNLSSHEMRTYCAAHKIDYVVTNKSQGFGENNNLIYHFYSEEITDDDYFVILNPDVYVDPTTLKLAINNMQDRDVKLATINLFRDQDYTVYDNSVRSFQKLKDFIKSYFFKKNTTIVKKEEIHSPTFVDWAAGSMLIFKSGLYKRLHGFNEMYFMYCEDIDICWRAKQYFSERVLYLPHLRGVHHAQFSNRRFLSKHFIWHVKSIIIFLSYKYGVISKVKSTLV